MNFYYETNRLDLRVINGTQAQSVLRFYEENKDAFDPYEPERSRNFYTLEFHRCVLDYEYTQMCKGRMLRYFAYLKENPAQLIGTVSIRNITRGSYQKCELGYKIAARYQGQGYGTEMVKKAVQICLFELDLHRVEAYCLPDNQKSIHLLTALGFQMEGVIRDHVQIQGRFQDHVLLSLLHP